ncbi:ras GTPase-activating-like protein IQGAP3 isoform X3 [Phyllopteryx taeniolatus]|uniref:ras GTPase-activating-like protein IQGAP3 isoform X3 n=1 Tax=Phyllopteryx taeniolatus TaxID=161469 RepID=UPI002AD4EB32|nr:ras GTPase-activating-like protein IQGAP3 isoform X3 [Phyllopteryx taeniolatus]
MSNMAESTAQSHYGRLTAEQMDEQRHQNVAYHYLCRLEEAKRWMEACLGEELPAPTELEEALRNGVLLAKLAHRFSPAVVPRKKIYDLEQLRYQAVGVEFRHTDNINHWRDALMALGLPPIFHPETTDIYDKKNMPRAVYCLHALSLYLFRLGLAPQITDLCGKVKFTEDEINNMRLELDKYGLQLPAFHKIGGILSNEMSVDEAAAHVAVIAINEAVDKRDVGATAEALRNPNAQLADLQEALTSVYQETLLRAKRRKARQAASRGGASEEKDLYEEFLTRREIQNNINTVNVRSAVERVDEAVDAADEPSLVGALRLPCLALVGVLGANGPWYLEQLAADRHAKALDHALADPLEPDELQEAVNAANREACGDAEMQRAVDGVNESLRGSDPQRTVSCLMSSDLRLPPVFPCAAALYHQQLRLLQARAGQGALQLEELFVAVEMLSAVVLVNQAVEAGNLRHLSSLLVNSSVGLTDVDQALMDKYLLRLFNMKQSSGREALTWNQLQEGIKLANEDAQAQHQQIVTLCAVNEALLAGDVRGLLSALLLPSSGVEDIVPANAWRYLSSMSAARQRKAQTYQLSKDAGAELWLAEIQEVVRQTNVETQKALKLCLAVAAVNQAVKEKQAAQTLRVLSLPEVALQGVTRCRAVEYQRQLAALAHRKASAGDNKSPWVRFRMRDGSSFFFHLIKLEGTWEEPPNFVHNSVFLDQQDIQEVVDGVLSAHRRRELWADNRALVTRLQSAIRGFLTRRRLAARRNYLRGHACAVVLIQAHWRRFVRQRAYRRRLQFLSSNWSAAVKIQAFAKMCLARRKYLSRLKFFRQNVGAVIKIQTFFRASRARAEYRMLVQWDTLPLSVLRKFAHLLDLGDADIGEEVKVACLREEVVRTVRFNRQLEADLDLMDLKIGLLVRNRATLQEVESHCKKLTRKNKEKLSDLMDVERSKGLKALSRESRRRLEAYQNLFYLLQTRPSYLAHLIFLMPQSRCSSFVEMVVFSLFNYGADDREAFLLLQLFTQALHFEIRSKVTEPQDVVRGNPFVIKMLVNFYRHDRGRNVLREALGPALRDVLAARNLSVRTDPLDVYKSWINQTESQSGLKSSLPYDVSPADALSHPEVRRRVDIAVVNLHNLTQRILEAITSNINKLPYGFRYLAKVLGDALRSKFPAASEDDVYKVVCNLVYYRFLNPAIVAPDAFDVLERTGVPGGLRPAQRRLLGSAARLLQRAAANEPFLGDGEHVAALNRYVARTHSAFRKFVSRLCDVPDPSERFRMDEYSEALVVGRPLVYISLGELVGTHELLLEHQERLCPEPTDPLRLLLSDVGPVPSLQELMGTTTTTALADPGSESGWGKTEVSLTLTNKFDVFDDRDDSADVGALLLSTKRLIVDVIGTQPGDTLGDVLQADVSLDQEMRHEQLMRRRALRDARTPDKMKRWASTMDAAGLSLEEKKRKIGRSIRRLEALGVLPATRGHRRILDMIAQDIRNRRFRRRRRGAELVKLGQTMQSLRAKSSFLGQQADYYEHYIASCLDELTADGRATGKKTPDVRGKKKVPVVSYTASRLHDKGVLLEIQELPTTQFKNVVFDILNGAEKGSFLVKARFLGVDMEEFHIKYQVALKITQRVDAKPSMDRSLAPLGPPPAAVRRRHGDEDVRQSKSQRQLAHLPPQQKVLQQIKIAFIYS